MCVTQCAPYNYLADKMTTRAALMFPLHQGPVWSFTAPHAGNTHDITEAARTHEAGHSAIGVVTTSCACDYVCVVAAETRLPGGGEGNGSNQRCQRALPGDKSNMIDPLHQPCVCVCV